MYDTTSGSATSAVVPAVTSLRSVGTNASYTVNQTTVNQVTTPGTTNSSQGQVLQASYPGPAAAGTGSGSGPMVTYADTFGAVNPRSTLSELNTYLQNNQSARARLGRGIIDQWFYFGAGTVVTIANANTTQTGGTGAGLMLATNNRFSVSGMNLMTSPSVVDKNLFIGVDGLATSGKIDQYIQAIAKVMNDMQLAMTRIGSYQNLLTNAPRRHMSRCKAFIPSQLATR